nr:hypothetical protein BaRGS_002240 [Batillaria attramentaria]
MRRCEGGGCEAAWGGDGVGDEVQSMTMMLKTIAMCLLLGLVSAQAPPPDQQTANQQPPLPANLQALVDQIQALPEDELQQFMGALRDVLPLQSGTKMLKTIAVCLLLGMVSAQFGALPPQSVSPPPLPDNLQALVDQILALSEDEQQQLMVALVSVLSGGSDNHHLGGSDSHHVGASSLATLALLGEEDPEDALSKHLAIGPSEQQSF